MYLKNFKYVESMGLKTRIIYTLYNWKKKLSMHYTDAILCYRIQTPSRSNEVKRHMMCVSQDNSPDNSAQVSVTKVDNCDFSVQHRASSSLKNLLHWTSYFLIKIPSNGRQFNKCDGVRHALGSSWRTWPMQVMMGLGW